MSRWIYYAVGYVFITSGMLKLIVPDFKVIFFNLGLPFPELTLFIIAITEIACGAFITVRMYLPLATVPLIVIMSGAILITKIPILSTNGFLSFAFEARLDIVMIILLTVIWWESRRIYIKN